MHVAVIGWNLSVKCEVNALFQQFCMNAAERSLILAVCKLELQLRICMEIINPHILNSHFRIRCRDSEQSLSQLV